MDVLTTSAYPPGPLHDIAVILNWRDRQLTADLLQRFPGSAKHFVRRRWRQAIMRPTSGAGGYSDFTRYKRELHYNVPRL